MTDKQMVDTLGLTDFKMVYQGGHHNVFCDGARHAYTNGGYTRLSPMNHIARLGKCNCAQFKQEWNAR